MLRQVCVPQDVGEAVARLAAGHERGLLLHARHAAVSPEGLFFHVGAGVVATGHKGTAGTLDSGERGPGIGHAADRGGVGFRTDEDEIVVHHGLPVHAVALGNKLGLQGRGVYEDDVDVALARELEAGAGTAGNDLDADPRSGLEIWVQIGQ